MAPSACHCAVAASSAWPASASSRGPPTRTSTLSPAPPAVASSTVAVTPTAGDDVKSAADGHREVPAPCGLDDGACQRVFGVGLRGGGERQHLVLGAAVPIASDRGDGGLALGQGAGLVEQHRPDRAHALQRHPVLDEHPAARGPLGGDGHDQRDGQTEGVRAGDHQHGDGADDGVLRLAGEAPHHRGDGRRAQCEPEQPARRLVGEALGA